MQSMWIQYIKDVEVNLISLKWDFFDILTDRSETQKISSAKINGMGQYNGQMKNAEYSMLWMWCDHQRVPHQKHNFYYEPKRETGLIKASLSPAMCARMLHMYV